jgi:DNA topoisomerase-6 subunit A
MRQADRHHPWSQHKKEWQKEIKQMLDNDFKLEVESLISKDITHVTEGHVPQRLQDKDFLD